MGAAGWRLWYWAGVLALAFGSPAAVHAETEAATGDDGPIPIWLWWEYDAGVPGFIELNLRALERHAPSPRFVIRKINKAMIKQLVPDMPEEFDRLPYPACISDLIRTALLVHHGGFYFDTDFLVQKPLGPIADMLTKYEFISYGITGQSCDAKGGWSSNFIAARKGNRLSVAAWAAVKEKLKQKCIPDPANKDRLPVCCYTKEGAPRTCNIPWAGIGERTSHPVSRRLAAEGELNIYCFRKLASFVPESNVTKGAPKGRKLNMYSMHWLEMDGNTCYRQGDDLVCTYPDAYTVSPNFFNRIAYHMFASIADRSIKERSADAILAGNWPMTDLYRQALGLEISSDGTRRRGVVPYQPAYTPDPEYVAASGYVSPTIGTETSEDVVASTPSTSNTSATPIPVWLWMDYSNGIPGYIKLNLRSLRHNAPTPRFEVRLVTREMLTELVPDMPAEFELLPYAAAVSDLIRTALIYHYGGFYLDTDFLVQKPLGPVFDLLSTHDFISYTTGGQDCNKYGSFSSNFIAGKKGNLLSSMAWSAIKDKLKTKCSGPKPENSELCCYTPEGSPRKCNIPWGGIGERTSHPIAKELVNSDRFKFFCYNGLDNFAPVASVSGQLSKEERLDMYDMHWRVVDGQTCKRVDDDLVCTYPTGTTTASKFFSRIAYHQFATISANKERKKISEETILCGNWAMSILHRQSLGIDAATCDSGKTDQPDGSVDGAERTSRATAVSKYIRPPENDLAAELAKPASWHLQSPQQCVTTYADFKGTTLDRSDQWQCPIGNVSFVHIPKTAGTAIENIAKRNGITWGHDYDWRRVEEVRELEKTQGKIGDLHTIQTSLPNVKSCFKMCPCGQGCCWWHIPPRYLMEWRPIYRYPTKFCVVRNPFERMLSQFSWLKGGKCPETHELMVHRDTKIQENLRKFKDGAWFFQDCHFIPQAWYVADHVDSNWMKRVWLDGDLSAAAPPAGLSVANAQSCNFVLRYQHLAEDLAILGQYARTPVQVNRNHKTYSQKCQNTALSQTTIDLIREIYAEDFDRFGYSQEWPVLTP